jgi:hypothetical protein
MAKGIGATLISDSGTPYLNEIDEAQIDVIRQELTTWQGLTKYWNHVKDYTEAASWEGCFPKGWDDFKSDLALYIYEVAFHGTEQQ